MTISTWRSCIIATATTAVAVGAFLGGCGSTATSSGSSQKGDSCASSFDCADGLACIENVCGGTTVTPEDGGQTQTDGGGKQDTGTTPPGKDGGKDTGPGSDTGTDTGTDSTTSAGLSALGERCGTTTDCASGLVCINTEEALGGICDLASFGLTATTDVCGGECLVAADCSELPVGNPIGATCGDILFALGGNAKTACATETAGEDDGTSNACFFYNTYCQPTATKAWTCTNNQCLFTQTCSVDVTDDLGGCASETRTGQAPANGTSCNMKTGKCGPTVVTPPTPECTSTSECNTGTLAVADRVGESCNGTDCVCSKSGNCYIKCASSLDCAAGLVCDKTTSLCEAAPECTTDAQCVELEHNPQAVCNTKTSTCAVSCTNDHDCSTSSGANQLVVTALGPFNGMFCDATTKTCATIGCTPSTAATGPDTKCPIVGSVNTFCVAPVPGVALVPAVESAITNN